MLLCVWKNIVCRKEIIIDVTLASWKKKTAHEPVVIDPRLRVRSPRTLSAGTTSRPTRIGFFFLAVRRRRHNTILTYANVNRDEYCVTRGRNEYQGLRRGATRLGLGYAERGEQVPPMDPLVEKKKTNKIVRFNLSLLHFSFCRWFLNHSNKLLFFLSSFILLGRTFS